MEHVTLCNLTLKVTHVEVITAFHASVCFESSSVFVTLNYRFLELQSKKVFIYPLENKESACNFNILTPQ